MLKYAKDYAAIRAAQRRDADTPPDLREQHFSLEALNGTFKSRLISKLTKAVMRGGALRLLQIFRPVQNLFGFTFVTRYDDVAAILAEHEGFEVPFGLEMAEMTGGVNFALGDDGELHDRQRPMMVKALSRDTVEPKARDVCFKVATALLSDSGGEINVAKDLFTRVAAEACLAIYGIKTDHTDNFAAYSMAGTSLLFADPSGDETYRRQALIGSQRLRAILNANMHDYIAMTAAQRKAMKTRGVLQSLLDQTADTSGRAAKWDQAALDEVRAMMFGLITGFVPTNTMAASGLLEQIRNNPRVFKKVKELARAAEPLRPKGGEPASNEYLAAHKALEDYVFEVARYNPALYPGQFRVRNGKPLGEHATPAIKKIKEGAVVMAATAQAMLQPNVVKNPEYYRNLMFGYQLHDCIGEGLARIVITETMQILMSRDGLEFETGRSATGMGGPFLTRQMMRFQPHTGHREQTMITVAIPFKRGVDIDKIRAHLKELNTDAAAAGIAPGSFKEDLHNLQIVHFASINALDLGTPDSAHFHLLLELNVDGGPEYFFRKFDALPQAHLHWLTSELDFKTKSRLARLYDWLFRIKSPTFTNRLTQQFWDHQITFKTRPFGHIGLNFPGTRNFPVAQIEAEEALYRKVQDLLEKEGANGTRYSGTAQKTATELMESLRDKVRASKDYDFAPLLYRPSARFPAFAKHRNTTFYTFIFTYVATVIAKIMATYGVLTIVLPLVIAGLSLAVFPLYVTFVMAPILIFLTILFGLVLWLRVHETIFDKPDDSHASHAHQQRIQAMEDLPGYKQNHLTSVSPMKPGPFRKLTMALALWYIKLMVVQWFKPGFVTDFATIHYAKWFRIKGTEHLIFQTNYDGSWESYLEDFITKVHEGQTGAWNNAIGFPRTNWWLLDGAQDGDQFKRWVRTQQVETLFWYVRYPNLTTDNIRTNALVRDGLARARTQDECTAFLKLFGSSPRPADSIETEQVQTLLFHGLGHHRHMSARILHFGDVTKAKAWLDELATNSRNAENPVAETTLSLTFGDEYPAASANFIALSAEGLEHLGFPDDGFTGNTTMPHAFVDAMANRSGVLGDDVRDTTEPANWRWQDRQPQINPRNPKQSATTSNPAAHAILLQYSVDEDDRKKLDDAFEVAKADFDLTVLDVVDAKDMNARGATAFGFRDGISQPIMRGTQAFAGGKGAKDDVVGPGEFILGYPDSRGYFPVSPVVPLADPAANLLPALDSPVHDFNPEFDRDSITDLRDFGRNGSFLVVRQLLHNNDTFNKFVEHHAKSLLGTPKAMDTAQSQQTKQDQAEGDLPQDSLKLNQAWLEDWVSAKVMGRWKDGSSLTRNPSMSRTTRNRDRFFTAVKNRIDRMVRDGVISQKDADNFWGVKANAKKKGATAKTHDVRFISSDGDTYAAKEKFLWNTKRWKEFVARVHAFEGEHGDMNLPGYLLTAPRPDNDFRHGTDDPQGLYCPLSSHVRRSNPRDSFRPNHEVQLEINNRHRLLRRGRVYERDDGETEGTFFMCFNANLERQFEFVQQTWIDSRAFHGGRDNPDPLVSSKTENDRFIIPGSEASHTLKLDDPDLKGVQNFTTVEAGGYFFMPSLQAIRYLANSKP